MTSRSGLRLSIPQCRPAALVSEALVHQTDCVLSEPLDVNTPHTQRGFHAGFLQHLRHMASHLLNSGGEERRRPLHLQILNEDLSHGNCGLFSSTLAGSVKLTIVKERSDQPSNDLPSVKLPGVIVVLNFLLLTEVALKEDMDAAFWNLLVKGQTRAPL